MTLAVACYDANGVLSPRFAEAIDAEERARRQWVEERRFALILLVAWVRNGLRPPLAWVLALVPDGDLATLLAPDGGNLDDYANLLVAAGRAAEGRALGRAWRWYCWRPWPVTVDTQERHLWYGPPGDVARLLACFAPAPLTLGAVLATLPSGAGEASWRAPRG